MKSARTPARLLAAALPAMAALALGTAALAQRWTGDVAPPPDLREAMAAAARGDAAPLAKLAAEGRPDAEFYSGSAYITGAQGLKKDGARGCGLVEKAARMRADALHLSGECYQHGIGGKVDPEKAKAAFQLAAHMGYPKSKCAYGEMLMAEGKEAARGLSLCKEAAQAGDAEAQALVGDAYAAGRGAKADPKEARRWYEIAANQNNTRAARSLGEMYARGRGGKKDVRKAVELWQRAEKAGDPMAAILVADQMFFDITGGKTPGPGKYAFRGGIPVQEIETTEAWYREARKTDPRPEVKKRAEYALSVLARFKAAASVQPKRK